MKKILLSVLSIALVGTAFSQATIALYGTSTDISGTTVPFNLTQTASFEHMFDFEVTNMTGSNASWMVTRYNVSNPSGWNGQFCWAGNAGVGNCYPAVTDDYQNSNLETVEVDSSGLLSVYITSTGSGTATYRYYISTDGQNYIDSIDVLVTSSLGIDEKPVVSVGISPNPASENIVINTSGMNNASVKIVDVLGNLVLDETMFESKKNINVSKFRNGVYFVLVEGEGIKPITRKVIVRH